MSRAYEAESSHQSECTVTDRTMISSGQYLELFESIPKHVRWTVAQIERSMRDTIDSRAVTGDLWVFAYGSLIGNPVCKFKTRHKTTLDGRHRSFCLRTIAGRSSPRLPGRITISMSPTLWLLQ